MATYIIVVLAIYFIVMIGISLVGRKHATNFDDYLSAGHSSGILMIAAATAGADIGNGLIVGGASEGSTVGLSGIAYGFGCSLGVIVFVVALTNFAYKNGYANLSEYLRKRYSGDFLPTIYNLVMVASAIGMIGSQLMAGKAVFEAFDIDGRIGVIAIAICVLVYSHISGLWGSYATSVAQVGVIVAGLIITCLVIVMNGGIDVINSAVDNGTVDNTFISLFKGYKLETWVAYVVPTMLFAVTVANNFMCVESAKDIRSAKIGQNIGAVLILFASLMAVVIGMFGKAKYGFSGDFTFVKVVYSTLPPIVTAILVVAIVAAVMSTVDSDFILISRIVLKDLYLGHINKNASEKKLSILILPLNLLVTVLGVVLALTETSIIGLISDTYVVSVASILVPFVGGIIWKEGTKEGAAASAITGIILFILQMSGIINMPLYAATIMIPGLFVYIAVSIATGKKVSITK